ncbi:hypothetical protein JCM17960_03000 [Magnetospira thiophila]
MALNNLAYLAGKTDPAKGLEAARQAWALIRRNPEPYIADTYGWLLVRSGEIDKGLPLLEFAYTKGQGSDLSTTYHFAVALAEAGQKVRAKATLLSILEQDFPEQAEAKALYEKLYFSLSGDSRIDRFKNSD